MSHVFCFDVPIHAEDYVHRIGRTGRAGREGRSFMLAAPEDGNAVAAIVKLIGREIPPIAIEGIEAAELEYGERRRAAGRAGRSSPIAAAAAPRRPDEAPAGGSRPSARAPRPRAPAERKKAAQQDLPASNVTSFPRARRRSRSAPAGASSRSRIGRSSVLATICRPSSPARRGSSPAPELWSDR